VVAVTKVALIASMLALVSTAALGAPGRPCTPRSAKARVRVSLLADSDLASLVKWARQQTCLDYEFDRELGGRRLGQSVIITVAGRDVESIVELILHSMNLEIRSKGAHRTIVAVGPESGSSKAMRERDKASIERDKVFDHIETEIKRKDETHFAITRKGFDAALVNFSSVSHTLRLVPEAKDGKPIGFRVRSLQRGSLLARVGLLNGDVVLAVNGISVTGPDKALEVYAKVRSSDDVQLSIMREGKMLALETKVE
jgi:type II secretory pathway component PulC